MSTIVAFKAKSQRTSLWEAQQRRNLVRLWHEKLESGSFCGYVGSVGREFVLLWVVSDDIQYGGLYAIRHRDINELEAPDKHHEFVEKALTLKGLTPKIPEVFPLESVRAVILAAGKGWQVISIHTEGEEESGGCYIGRLISVEEDSFTLQEISPDAVWMREVSCFTWDEVLAVSMEEGYAKALLMVAGDPPPVTPVMGFAH